MTFSHQDRRQTVEARVDASMKERVEEFAEDHGMNQSEVLREALGDYLPDDGLDIETPDDRDLRETYLWLRERADPDTMHVPSDAIGELAQHVGTKKKVVKRTRLKPLARRGWIDPQFGYIKVVEYANR